MPVFVLTKCIYILYILYVKFEWDINKRLANIEKHGYDFRVAVNIFEDTVVEIPQRRNDEARILALGILNNHVIAVVYTWRGKARRIISARKASRKERNLFESNT